MEFSNFEGASQVRLVLPTLPSCLPFIDAQ